MYSITYFHMYVQRYWYGITFVVLYLLYFAIYRPLLLGKIRYFWIIQQNGIFLAQRQRIRFELMKASIHPSRCGAIRRTRGCTRSAKQHRFAPGTRTRRKVAIAETAKGPLFVGQHSAQKQKGKWRNSIRISTLVARRTPPSRTALGKTRPRQVEGAARHSTR